MNDDEISQTSTSSKRSKISGPSPQIIIFESKLLSILGSRNEEQDIIDLRKLYVTDVLNWLKHEIDRGNFLHAAITKGKKLLVQELIELGANVDHMSTGDSEPLSCLDTAIKNNKLDVALLLLKYKCKMHKREKNETELFLVAQHCDHDNPLTKAVIIDLLKCGVNYNEMSTYHKTAEQTISDDDDEMIKLFKSCQNTQQIVSSEYERVIATSDDPGNRAQFKLKNFYIARIEKYFRSKTFVQPDWLVQETKIEEEINGQIITRFEPILDDSSGFWVESEGIQSLTAANIATFRDKFILQNLHKFPADTVIFDATASSGADTFSFLYNFQGPVISNEMHDYIFKMLHHNCAIFKKTMDYKSHRCRLGNAFDFLESVNPTDNNIFDSVQMIYIDLPWGGNFKALVPDDVAAEEASYTTEQNLMLQIMDNGQNKHDLDQFILDCFKKRPNLKFAVLKLPKNFDRRLIINLVAGGLKAKCYRIFEEKYNRNKPTLRSLNLSNFDEKMIFAVVEKSQTAEACVIETPLFTSTYRNDLPEYGNSTCRAALERGEAGEQTSLSGYPTYHQNHRDKVSRMSVHKQFWFMLNQKLECLLEFF